MHSRILILITLLIITNCDEILDIFPPEIDLISPKDRVLIENSAIFIVTASDNKGLDRVEFSLIDEATGNKVEKTFTTEPYEIELTNIQTWKQIQFEAYAYDDVGNWSFVDKQYLIQTSVDNAKLKVLSPNGGEIWQTGSTKVIRWSSEDVVGSISIELFRSNNSITKITNSTNNDGAFDWVIPDALSANANYKIKVSWNEYASIYDESDSFFSITKPTSTNIMINND